MITTLLFSQNDPRWKADKHGTSSSTLGATGCTISALCAILGHAGYKETPKTVDDKLAANGGYSEGNLLVWGVVPKLWPKLKLIGRYKQYTSAENTKAKEWIAKGMIPLIEVGSQPIGGSPGGKHWVTAHGESKSGDPWPYPAQIKTFDVWDPVGMALYEYTPSTTTPGETPMPDTIVVSTADWEKCRNNSETLDKVTDGLGLPRNSKYPEIEERTAQEERAEYQRGYDQGVKDTAVDPTPPIDNTVDLEKYTENGLTVEEVVGSKKYIVNYRLK